MSLEIGQTVGDYEIVDVLGQGGMGSVYKVRNTLSERLEAMKVLLPNLREVPELADRFLREIKVQAKLEHPNITTLRTAFRDGNQLLMVMELVEGVSLDFVVKAQRIAVENVRDYARQVLGALSYAHSMGVIHRDLKPANMLLTPRGVIKLTDFGIAHDRADRKLTRTGVAMGSLYYISPEQVQGKAPDARSDIYALGITLYELVTGSLPFQGDTDYALMTAHLHQTPQPPMERDPSIPGDLSELILKAIAKDPNDRFQSAGEFLEALSTPGKAVITSIRPAAAPQIPPVGAATRVTQAPVEVPPPPPAPPRSKMLIPVAAVSLLVAAGAVIWNRSNPPAAVVPQQQQSTPAEGSQTPAGTPVPTPSPSINEPAEVAQPPGAIKSEQAKARPTPTPSVSSQPALETKVPALSAPVPTPTPAPVATTAVTPPPTVNAPPPKAAPLVVSAPARDPRLEEWERLSNSRDAAALEAFRQRATDKYSALAVKRIEELEWEAARGSRDPQRLRAFRDKYPASPHAAEAVAEAEGMERAQAHRGIQDVLARYRAAFESRNIAALTSIWPTLSGAQLQTLTNAFKDYKSIEMSLMPAGDPQFNGNQVSIRCNRSQKIVLKNGQTLAPQHTVTFQLKRAGAGWQIESIQQ
ncbi:MAG: protein kinase [Bryobacterales bacterium]|nr:protein kinase [Bryobacterales bacterium]